MVFGWIYLVASVAKMHSVFYIIVFDEIPAERVWYDLMAHHTDDLEGLCVPALTRQWRALDAHMYSLLFGLNEKVSLEKATTYDDLDKVISAAVKRSASAVMKSFYKALMKSVDTPGAGRHREIAEKVLDGQLNCVVFFWN